MSGGITALFHMTPATCKRKTYTAQCNAVKATTSPNWGRAASAGTFGDSSWLAQKVLYFLECNWEPVPWKGWLQNGTRLGPPIKLVLFTHFIWKLMWDCVCGSEVSVFMFLVGLFSFFGRETIHPYITQSVTAEVKNKINIQYLCAYPLVHQLMAKATSYISCFIRYLETPSLRDSPKTISFNQMACHNARRQYAIRNESKYVNKRAREVIHCGTEFSNE